MSKPLNVVLVEDDEVDVMNVQRAFEKASIHAPVFRAGDGVEALDLLDAKKYGFAHDASLRIRSAYSVKM